MRWGVRPSCKRVWEWKVESGGTIVNQLKRLGASCDWSRERFTMDEGLSRAVLKVFVELHRAGLIYKDKRLVNWDPKLLTAISDLEVIQVETKGHLWYLRYPLEGKTFKAEDPSTYIVVATTRPETMLGDTAVAVNPEDDRYKTLIGTNAILPLVGRKIPILGDEISDPEKGSGAVKITPAHDFGDFEVGKRHNLPQINVLTPEAKIVSAFSGNFGPSPRADEVILPDGTIFSESDVEQVPEILRGLDRFAARKRIVELLETQSLVEKIEANTHVVPHGDRSNVVIEPYLTDQWYVNAKELAKPAIAAVRNGKTKFIPKNWEKTYFDWMENIQPWCISRQLWWGHQIPAWYGFQTVGSALRLATGNTYDRVTTHFVAADEPEAIRQAGQYSGKNVVVVSDQMAAMNLIGERGASVYPIWRDEDVLDTWFSSALWPFSTLGWPDKTEALNRYYPTSTLVTGFDIIFFWVARMMMMGLHFMQKERPGAPLEEVIPFHDVYIHALVRDASGAKMSKSKGNVIDPLALIDDYGADALRFTLAAMAAMGRDIKLSTQRVEGYRNFATKLWNAARFAEMNGCAAVAKFDPKSAKETLNRWIAHETAKAAAEVTEAIEAYRFNDAAAAVYRFVWNIYCDWYLELAKPLLAGPDGAGKSETQAMVAWARDEILKLLHPFMPFVTEELWAVTGKHDALLALDKWSTLSGLADDKAEAEIGWVIDLVTAIRSVRAEMNITAAIPLVLAGASTGSKARAERWAEFIKRLARVSDISSAAAAPKGSVQLVVRGEVAALPLKGVIDLAAERARLAKEMQKADGDIARVDAKLNNPNFMARAPEEVVEEEQEKREEALARKTKIAEALDRLKDAT